MTDSMQGADETQMDAAAFDRMRGYIDFGEELAAALADFGRQAEPYLSPVIDDFYDAIDRHPEARQVITGGQEQVLRLKRTLNDWLRSLLAGKYGEEYLRRRLRIGRVHVRIGLPQHLMFTAMSRVRTQLLGVSALVLGSDPQRAVVERAMHMLLDLELCIMLQSYRDDLIQKQRAQERLATIGELAASVAHELRNPLGTIETSMFLIRQQLDNLGIDDKKLQKHEEKVSRQVRHCSHTISRLLDLARAEPPRREPVSLRTLFSETVEHLRLDERIRVLHDLSSELVVFADRTQLGLVLDNLIRNAEESTEQPVTVQLSARPERGGVTIDVVDDGPGVPPEAHDRLFEALFTTKSQGTGLGLALSARIIDAHGGEMTLQPSETGARIRFWLPGPPAEGPGTMPV